MALNRETIIACYDKKRIPFGTMKRFARNFSEFCTEEVQIPEFKSHRKNSSSENEIDSLNQTVSFISELSRIRVDSVIYKEIEN